MFPRYVPKVFPSAPVQSRLQSTLSLKETGKITLQVRDLCHLRANTGRRSNEALAKGAIQLFGLFRVFGEQLEGSQTNLREIAKPRARPFLPG